MKTRPIRLAALFIAVVAGTGLVSLTGGSVSSHTGPVPFSAGEPVAEATAAFLASLSDEQRERALFAFDDEQRFDFHFIPRPRRGLPLADMKLPQRRAAHDLLQAALSNQGYLKVTHVMQLESILRELENDPDRRDPEKYYISIFGLPGGAGPWGWRIEGHHLSLNFTSVTDELSVTPAFYGSNPAEVRTGPYAGLRVLAAEEDLGRALVTMLTGEQRAQAVIAATAPSDVITSADREARIETLEGLPAWLMTPEQKDLLWRIVDLYAQNLEAEQAERHLARIVAADIDSLYFAWAGSLERGEPHYYRIHGPTDLFEYDNTQNGANHVHSVWRNFENDFGLDLLRRHYDTAEPGHGH